LSTAEEYAKKAAGLRPKDPSYARLLADIHRAAGRLGEAETTLLHAIELNSENDVLMAELRSDLEAIKRSGPTGAPAGGGRGRR
jgi:Flp pilus assembly protein TadD